MLDPALLSARDAVRLYARRWDIELAFRLVKRELGLHLLWSARWEVILTQIWATLLIAQIVSALRADIARRAGVDLFDVSIALLLRELPCYAARGEPDVLDQIIARGSYGGIIRPARRRTPSVPAPLPVTPPPPDLARTRPPRYAGRRCGPQGADRPLARCPARPSRDFVGTDATRPAPTNPWGMDVRLDFSGAACRGTRPGSGTALTTARTNS